MMAYQHLLLFGSVVVAACFLVVYFWPRIILIVYKRAILVKGFGEGAEGEAQAIDGHPGPF